MEKEIVHIGDDEVVDDFNSLMEGSSSFDDVRDSFKSKQIDCIRYTIAFDATSSMEYVWNSAISAVKETVDKLKGYKVSKPIYINIIAYRDICDEDAIYQQSGFSDDSNYLKSWIKKVRCHGGGDFPENVEMALRGTLGTESNMMILIGDAPPHNFPDKNTDYRQTDWDGKKEAIELGKSQCPVYAMYVDDMAQCNSSTIRAFEAIAALSGGKAYPMNLHNFGDILMTLLSRDKDLIKHSMAYIPYMPISEDGKKIKEDMK